MKILCVFQIFESLNPDRRLKGIIDGYTNFEIMIRVTAKKDLGRSLDIKRGVTRIAIVRQTRRFYVGPVDFIYIGPRFLSREGKEGFHQCQMQVFNDQTKGIEVFNVYQLPEFHHW
ncbi:hypothetical protein SLE2022_239480 [Rubroshorea leprosula]